MEHFLYHLLSHINRKKIEPLVVSYSPGKPLSLFKSLRLPTAVIPINNHRLDLPMFLKIIRHYRPNIIQSNYYTAWMAVASYIANVPHVWHVPGHIFSLNGLNQQHKRECLNAIARLSNQIVCPSQFIRKQFDPILKNRSKIHVIYNATRIPLKKNNAMQLDNDLKRRFLVGMIGHFSPQKRHIDFILAAKKVRKIFPYIKFFIFAISHHKQERPYINYLCKMIKNFALDKEIIFSEFSGDSLKSIEKMNLTVLPSINEGGSLAVIEAMAAGKPVVASHSGANPEYIQNGITGLLVPPKNPSQLAEAIIQILKNPRDAIRMGLAGQKRAEKLFNIATCTRQYEHLYESILL